jgi:hypothetical protein
LISKVVGDANKTIHYKGIQLSLNGKYMLSIAKKNGKAKEDLPGIHLIKKYKMALTSAKSTPQILLLPIRETVCSPANKKFK